SGETISFVNHPISFFTGKINTLDFIVTDNEIEALILESSLIKKNRPKYNIHLKDDKSYPYIAFMESEQFPRVFITRNRNIKGARYFGPYTNVKSIKETLEVLRKVFQIRDCRKSKPGKIKNSVCLNYHINLCSAPCMGKISGQDYKKNVGYIKMFLKGNDKTIINSLKSEMNYFAEGEEFEKAAEIKKKIDAINDLLVRQKIFFSSGQAWDILAVSKDNKANMAVVSLYNYKGGELAAINNFIISGSSCLSEGEIISGFIKSYYSEVDNISSVIYLPFEIDEIDAISGWLSEIKGKKIDLKVAKIGGKKEIIKMAQRNAYLYLEKKKFEKSSGYSRVFKELVKLKDTLDLINIPKRIECFDISNIGPVFAVGSMAVFADGSPLNSNYRHFKIKNVSGQDDLAMIAEIVSRRLKYLEHLKVSIEDSFYIKPDLIVIDGGKAQFNIVKKILDEKNIQDIDLMSIAKKEEIIFCSKFSDGIKLDPFSRSLNIIIKIRDEAHRFALNYHKKLRDNNMTRSILDGIKGIGEKKKEHILEKFGTVEDLKSIKIEDLLKIKGLSYRDAVSIFDSLNR
ncbi:MAG: excinuclease ABC subunit UvrC, partial [Actinobacteria bacterium]|nr:excinuclease ABC subunit UvrC [Actinomycetota bacterium]